MLRKITYRSGAFLLLFAMMWMANYALIEFHQKYVFGNYHEWTKLSFLKTGEKTFKKSVQSEASYTGYHRDQDDNPAEILTGLTENKFLPVITFDFSERPCPESLDFRFINPPLRAPPAI